MTEWQTFLMYIGIITLSTVVTMFLLYAFTAIETGIRKLKQIISNRQEKSVVHGHWTQVDDTKCRCSNCDIIALIGLYPHGDKNYCPNCGAKMDEGKGDFIE